jgi:hypothetical protein
VFRREFAHHAEDGGAHGRQFAGELHAHDRGLSNKAEY